MERFARVPGFAILLGTLLIGCQSADDTPGLTPAATASVPQSAQSTGTPPAPVPTPSPTATSPAAVPLPVVPSLARGTSTQVIRYEPPTTVTETASGICEQGSREVRRADAWSCDGGNYDPCFGDLDAVFLICVRFGIDEMEVTRFDLKAPLCTGPSRACNQNANLAAPTPTPWFVLLGDGQRCVLKGRGTSPVINGDRLNYYCPTNNLGLIGFPTPGPDGIWTARAVVQPDDPAVGTLPELPVQLQTVVW